MNLLFRANSFREDYKSISSLLLLEGKEHNRAKRFLCESFQLDTDFVFACGADHGIGKTEIEDYLIPILQKEYQESEQPMKSKIAAVSERWSGVSDKVSQILDEVYGTTYPDEPAIRANFTINYMCPYDYGNQSFDVNFRKSTEEIIESCIHEIIHFYWFRKWEILFKEKYSEHQHLIWKFSEIAIDAIFRETDLKGFCVREKPAYQYFYGIELHKKNLMEYFRELFVQNGMEEFMEKGIGFLIENENLIPD